MEAGPAAGWGLRASAVAGQAAHREQILFVRHCPATPGGGCPGAMAFGLMSTVVRIDENSLCLNTQAMWTRSTPFASETDKVALEEGTIFAPRFDAQGLISAIVVDHESKDVLMLAHMNAEALALTIDTGHAWYYSRSRQQLWRKGETSGHIQDVISIKVDCDQDALLLVVRQTGPACHTNRESCFYREIRRDADGAPELVLNIT
jgi:phosphoribosyl-AMP cyclohydrolase